MRGRRTQAGGGHGYPRSARVNEVLREVLAEAIERLADKDERLNLLTVTAVQTEPGFRRAKVLFASLGDDAKVALEAARPRLQAVIGGQVRLKRTPQLSFHADPAVSTGYRVEEILRNMRDTGDIGGVDGGAGDDR